MGCVNCHDPDDTVEGPAVGGDGKRSLALSGKLRASEGNRNGRGITDDNFYLPAEQSFNLSTTSKLPSAVLTKQKGDNTLVCFTCHSGRSNVYLKNDDYAANTYGTKYIHNDPAAGNVAGILLPKIKDAVFANGLETRSGDTNWSTHANGDPNYSGDKFPKCTQCHNINKDGHSLAVYRDSDGNPLIQDITDSSLIDIGNAASVYATALSGTEDKKCSCHGLNGADRISESKNTAKGFAEVMAFYEDAFKIKSLGGFGGIYWTGRGWGTTSAATPPAAIWTLGGDKEIKKFAAALTFDALIHDWGAYAHLGVGNLRQTLGEALAFIYQNKINGLGDAAGFKAWLETDGEPFTDDSGNLSKLGPAGLEFLCPNEACDYDSWKSAAW
jgi:hypothetical protein